MKDKISASSSAAAVLKSLKETKIIDMTKKGYDIVKEELTSTPSRRRRMKNVVHLFILDYMLFM